MPRDRRGQFSLIFALSSMALLTAVGSGFDLGRAYIERQELSSAAALTCQYAGRSSVTALNYGSSPSAYATEVNTYLTNTLAAQKLAATQTVATPFSVTGTVASVSLAARVPTTLMNLVGVRNVPVSASVNCAAVPQGPPGSNQQVLVSEGFENSPCTNPQNCVHWHLPNGTMTQQEQGTPINPVLAPASAAGYVGVSGTQWFITGYCLEIDGVQTVANSVPQGSYSAELDCDNGHGSAGNSSISTRLYLQANQQYELRYYYKARLSDDAYTPAYICGSAASDTSWANDPNYYLSYGGTTSYTYANSPQHFGARTNQINVYLDPETSTGSYPLHTTLDGSEQLGGSNLIDECVYATDWVERSVMITPSTAGYYWLSFAADGANDSYGGLVDYIQLCQNTCSGTVQDNFPTAWSSVNNGGNYKTLFEDTFEAPVYSPASASAPDNVSGNLNTSYGTSGTSSSGWANAAASGWTTSPTNRITYITASSAQGTQALQLAWTGANSQISRPFLLVPGYYKVTYDYVANAIFSSITTTYCGSTPAAANLSASYGNASDYTWRPTNHDQNAASAYNANATGVFLSNAQLVSTPIGGGTLNSTTSYNNPDGTVSTTPTVSPSAISLTSYNASQSDALLDICGYAATWQTRAVYFRIVKPAYYWLTFAGLGTSPPEGGSIDDVKLTGLDGPYMSGAPTSFVTIPVPNPQPNSTIGYTGFSFPAEGQYQ